MKRLVTLEKDQLVELERRWREASDAAWEARLALFAAREDPAARREAELRLQRAEIQVANLRQALLLFSVEVER